MTQIYPTGANPLRMDFEIHRIGDPGVVVTRGAQSLVYEIDGYRYAFTGSGLVYGADGGPVAGWVDSFQFSKDGAVLFDTGPASGWGYPPVNFTVPNLIGDHRLLESLLSGNDDIHGSNLDDWIVDHFGHNNLYGGGGNDTIVAGNGNDHVYGHSASGGADGNDYIEAGDGSDYVQGNAGNDLVLGGGGSDRINGGADNDTLFGNDGNDTINGNRGDDAINGDAGNDVLRGGQGNDGLAGGDGDDILMGDLGADFLSGGAGADRFVFGAGTSPIGTSYEEIDRIFDFEDGIDHIALGFMPVAVLTGAALQTHSGLYIDGGRAAAQMLFNQHPGDAEVAVIGGEGSPTLIFWSTGGGALIDSMVMIYDDPTSAFGLDDFI